jgi:nucleoid-associated protein YgaU
MAIKSAYREKPAVETPAPNIPAPSEKLHVELIDKTDPDKGTVAAIDTAIPTDEATLALQKQLADLRKSEELQRQYAMHQHAVQMSQRAQPQTRVQFLQSQGLTKTEAEWFDSREDRGTPSGETGQRPLRTIRLTAEEQEYARVAGISDVEYARQKQKLAQAKAAGDYGERR